ncbi:hypothetical protein F4818DRAFT_446838 [Hypoxylon cercidicola]|nr:hypothetical protein F4818DRAFT_446838 [Hypoxylon cercidicola]
MSMAATKREPPSSMGAISDDELEVAWRDRSLPKQQFADLILEEMGRIWNADPRSEGRTDRHLHVNRRIRGGWLYDRAREEVQAQWVEQGIWKDSWEHMELGPPYTDTWKHETQLSFDPLDASSAAGQISSTEARSRPRWRAEMLRQREASRPINMFLYQVTNECERLSDQARGDPAAAASDINSQAYGRVRARWVARHIWDDGWGVLPGMSWPHEKPLPGGSGSGSKPERESSGEGETMAKAAGDQLMRDKQVRERLAARRGKKKKTVAFKAGKGERDPTADRGTSKRRISGTPYLRG